MSDEEKKAIEHIKNYPINWLIENVNESAIKIVLNLIEKQSKEIEELKYKVREHICIEAHEQVKQLYISKDRIKEILHLTDEECDSEEKILSLLKTIWDEFNRLEDIEDRKVQVDYERVFNKGVKSVEDKIKSKIKEYDDKGMTINLANRRAGKTFQQAVHYEVKKVLQSLLEKE